MRFAEIKTPIVREYDRESHILVIDDDESLLKFFKIHLNKFFSKVIVVENAKQAMKVMGEKPIDLVICDIKMPGVDGIALLQKIKKEDKTIPVYMISGGILTKEQQALVEKHAVGLLKKPFSVDEIQSLINKGVNVRTQMKKLVKLIPNKKTMEEILKNPKKLDIVKNKEKRKEVESILKKIA